MTERIKPELLAPAGSPQALRAAVENGADAVYLGGRSFSARASAENFTRDEFSESLRYAHLRGVKVYVTVNTLVDNREFAELADYLFFLFQEGTDALLVQDLGVVNWAREVLPGMPLHGSTQMTVHNAAGVDWLAGLGFTRVVLARETSRDDLQLIRERTSMELEVFVHGALCFCYSGQCLFSSMVGGRSGNRGRCAQPCRLTYRLVDEQDRDLSQPVGGEHLLSPKDLMLLGELPELIDLGIASLKIEGRMKRPEYVATVVRVYREALDRAYDDP
jgi:putative protease